MIDQWVIDRLDPLKGEKLIILADPQPMIRAGARAVDGWAKNGAQPTRGSSVERRRLLHGDGNPDASSLPRRKPGREPERRLLCPALRMIGSRT